MIQYHINCAKSRCRNIQLHIKGCKHFAANLNADLIIIDQQCGYLRQPQLLRILLLNIVFTIALDPDAIEGNRGLLGYGILDLRYNLSTAQLYSRLLVQ